MSTSAHLGSAATGEERKGGHTPGPWRASRYGAGYWIVGYGQNNLLASYIRDEGVATLMASAPDLLKAMRRIEPYLDAIVCYASTCGEHEPNDIVREFRAAIAKATGSAQ